MLVENDCKSKFFDSLYFQYRHMLRHVESCFFSTPPKRSESCRFLNFDHENVDVCLSVGGTEIAKVNLAEFLRQHPAIDCSKHEVLIPIEIRFIEGEVVITIPEWAIDVIQPDFSNKTEI